MAAQGEEAGTPRRPVTAPPRRAGPGPSSRKRQRQDQRLNHHNTQQHQQHKQQEEQQQLRHQVQNEQLQRHHGQHKVRAGQDPPPTTIQAADHSRGQAQIRPGIPRLTKADTSTALITSSPAAAIAALPRMASSAAFAAMLRQQNERQQHRQPGSLHAGQGGIDSLQVLESSLHGLSEADNLDLHNGQQQISRNNDGRPPLALRLKFKQQLDRKQEQIRQEELRLHKEAKERERKRRDKLFETKPPSKARRSQVVQILLSDLAIEPEDGRLSPCDSGKTTHESVASAPAGSPCAVLTEDQVRAAARQAVLQLRGHSSQCRRAKFNNPADATKPIAVRPSSSARRLKQPCRNDELGAPLESELPRNNASSPAQAGSLALQVDPRLMHPIMTDEAENQHLVLKQRHSQALSKLKERVIAMRKSYDAVHAQAEQLGKQRRGLEGELTKYKGMCEQAEANATDQMQQCSALEDELAALNASSAKLEKYRLTMQHMLERVRASVDETEKTMSERASSVQVLSECHEEASSYTKIIQKERDAVVRKRAALTESIQAASKQYFEKLDDRRSVIGQIDVLVDYVNSRDQQSDNVRQSARSAKFKSLTELQNKLRKHELSRITAIMAQRNHNPRNAQQVFGQRTYTMREIQEVLKRIEANCGIKIITPQELVDWAHANREVSVNITGEERQAQLKRQELSAAKRSLTEKLAALEHESGSADVQLKRSAYEELHRKILQERHRKQDAMSRIQEHRGRLASFLVSMQGLVSKLGQVSLKEEWVHKLDTSLLLTTNVKRGSAVNLKLGGMPLTKHHSQASLTTDESSGGDTDHKMAPNSTQHYLSPATGKRAGSTTGEDSVGAARSPSAIYGAGVHDDPHSLEYFAGIEETLRSVRETKHKIGHIVRLCTLGAQVGLLRLANGSRFIDIAPEPVRSPVQETIHEDHGEEKDSTADSSSGGPSSEIEDRAVGPGNNVSPEGRESNAAPPLPTILRRMRLNLLDIEAPNPATNVRVAAEAQEELVASPNAEQEQPGLFTLLTQAAGSYDHGSNNSPVKARATNVLDGPVKGNEIAGSSMRQLSRRRPSGSSHHSSQKSLSSTSTYSQSIKDESGEFGIGVDLADDNGDSESVDFRIMRQTAKRHGFAVRRRSTTLTLGGGGPEV